MTALRQREQKKQERRDAIIAAAVRVFLERSVQATTMDEIAREAEVSKGALYLYFSSKEELLLSVAIQWLDELQADAEALRSQHNECGLEMIRAGMKLYARHALANPGHFKVAISWLNTAYPLDETSALFQEYRAAVAQKYAFMIEAIERGKRDGSVMLFDPPEKLAVQLWGSMLGMILVEQNADELARRLPPFGSTARGSVEAFIDNILSALGGNSHRAPNLKEVSEEESPS